MEWKAHVILGSAFTLVFTFLANYWFGWYDIYRVEAYQSLSIIILIAEILVISLVSPLVPDLDHPMSVLHRWVLGLGLFTIVFGVILMALNSSNIVKNDQWVFFIVVGLIVALMTFLLPIMSHHRGIVHSIPFCILYGMGIFVLTSYNWQLGILGATGSFSHLIFDGIPLKMK